MVRIVGDDSDTERPPTSVSALEGKLTAADRLPGFVLKSPTRQQFATPLKSVRATSVDGRDYYIVEGVRDQLCLNVVAAHEPSSQANCGPKAQLVRDGAMWGAGIDYVARKLTISGIVADGYEIAKLGAETVAVRRNVFVIITDIPKGRAVVEISGPSVPTRQINTGPTSVPGPGKTVTG